MSAMASLKSSLPSQTHTGTELPGYFPTNAPFTERDLESQSAPTKTSRAFGVLSSALKIAVKTASVAMYVAPLAILASTLAPASTRSAVVSTVSSAFSKIPKGALTEHLSTAASYALNHLPTYKNAVLLSKVALGYQVGKLAERRRAAKEEDDFDEALQEFRVALKNSRKKSIESFRPQSAESTSKVEGEPEI